MKTKRLGSTGLQVSQLALGLRGHLDGESFTRAWQQAVDRHAALRTTFVWEDLAEPLQVVHRSVRLPLFEADQSSRKDWEEQYGKGLKLLGFTFDERTKPFKGAAAAAHPPRHRLADPHIVLRPAP